MKKMVHQVDMLPAEQTRNLAGHRCGNGRKILGRSSLSKKDKLPIIGVTVRVPKMYCEFLGEFMSVDRGCDCTSDDSEERGEKVSSRPKHLHSMKHLAAQ